MKKCTKCKEEKKLSMFTKSPDNKDGYQRVCKKCKSARDRELQKEKKFYKQFEIV